MSLKFILKLYKNNSVSICGKKGRGKDMLTANIIARRRPRYYVSNVDYKLKGKVYIPFNPLILRVGNTFENFLTNKFTPYYYPYPDGTDFYISDCGIYFPSQYNGELNKNYRDIPTFMALSRQLGDCYVHTNAQALSRVWDKIREQSDIYITCKSCKVLFKRLVIQRVLIYEKYDSAVADVPPCKIRLPLNADARQRAILQKEDYRIKYGSIKSKLLIYVNRSKYDTRLFKTFLEEKSAYENS